MRKIGPEQSASRISGISNIFATDYTPFQFYTSLDAQDSASIPTASEMCFRLSFFKDLDNPLLISENSCGPL